jgi:hypothetical protein
MAQLLDGFRQFRQQGGRATAMEQSKRYADATANSHRPEQRDLPFQTFFHGITPEHPGQPCDDAHDQGDGRSAHRAGEQSHQA